MKIILKEAKVRNDRGDKMGFKLSKIKIFIVLDFFSRILTRSKGHLWRVSYSDNSDYGGLKLNAWNLKKIHVCNQTNIQT